MIDKSATSPKPGAKPGAKPGPAKPAACNDVRDVADFHLRWPEFRPIASNLSRNPSLSAAESDTLVWMIELLNRIGPQDLEDGNP